LKNGHNCVFTGRALDRAHQDLLTSNESLKQSQTELASTQEDLLTSRSSLRTSQSDLRFLQIQISSIEQDLHDSRQLVASMQQQVADSQRNLTTSQLDLMISQHQGRMQAFLLDIIFKRLKAPNNSLNPDLKELASQSRDTSEFMEKLSALADEVKQRIGSSLPWDIMSVRLHPELVDPLVTNSELDHMTPRVEGISPTFLYLRIRLMGKRVARSSIRKTRKTLLLEVGSRK
jgi:hypothetical protein